MEGTVTPGIRSRPHIKYELTKALLGNYYLDLKALRKSLFQLIYRKNF